MGSNEASEQSEALADLRFHWGSAYRFTAQAGVWEAVRLDTGATLRADDALGLLLKVRADYERHPVPRDL